jgi:hypothetical protein
VFCQQLGVFGREEPPREVIQAFVYRMLRHFRYGTVNFNVLSRVDDDRRLGWSERHNFVLPLKPSYDAISSAYAVNTRRNLKRSLDHPGEVERDIPLEELIIFKREHDNPVKPGSVYNRMRSLFGSVAEHSRGCVYGIRDGEELVAATFIAFSRTRVFYLLSVSSEKGKEIRAMFRIVDALIRDHEESGLILDFEGSTISSIARFFGGFGAAPEIYQGIRFRRFPYNLIPGRRYGG